MWSQEGAVLPLQQDRYFTTRLCSEHTQSQPSGCKDKPHRPLCNLITAIHNRCPTLCTQNPCYSYFSLLCVLTTGFSNSVQPSLTQVPSSSFHCPEHFLHPRLPGRHKDRAGE